MKQNTDNLNKCYDRVMQTKESNQEEKKKEVKKKLQIDMTVILSQMCISHQEDML